LWNLYPRRTDVINGFLRGELSTTYKMTNIECVYLQFRKVLELIALASLVANHDEYVKQQTKFAQHWHAGRILDDLAQVNPQFYPVPGVQVIDKATGKVREVKPLQAGYLTKADFIALYEMCGGILHAQNPYGQPKDINAYESQMPEWRDKIIALLNHHQIQLIDSKLQLWVIMHSKDDGRVHGFLFSATLEDKMKPNHALQLTAASAR
jgi:hypothetical protein